MATESNRKLNIPYLRLFASYAGWTIIGIVIGFVFLVNQAPRSVLSAGLSQKSVEEKAPFEIRNRVVQYQNQGFALGGATLTRKLYATGIDPTAISISELNAWAKESFGSPNQTPGQSKGFALTLQPSAPQFAIADEKLHVTCPINLSLLKRQLDIKLLCSGVFENQGSPHFQPISLAINAAPVPFHSEILGFFGSSINKLLERNESVRKVLATRDEFTAIELAETAIVLHRN
jgi:hypothetical protein